MSDVMRDEPLLDSEILQAAREAVDEVAWLEIARKIRRVALDGEPVVSPQGGECS